METSYHFIIIIHQNEHLLVQHILLRSYIHEYIATQDKELRGVIIVRRGKRQFNRRVMETSTWNQITI